MLHAAMLAGWIFLAWLPMVTEFGGDAFAYWAVDLASPYEGTYGQRGFFPYSPAAALAVAPFSLLPLPIFLAVWTAILVGTLIWLTGPRFLLCLALPPVAVEIVQGNITLLLAVAIVLGFRWPAAWALVLLTKVTPGIGLAWFAVRREWRNLALALGATGLIVLLTALILPAQWIEWLQLLSIAEPQASVVPLLPRIPMALALVIWGGLTDRRWTVVAAATLAVPRMGFPELSLLLGVYALRRRD